MNNKEIRIASLVRWAIFGFLLLTAFYVTFKFYVASDNSQGGILYTCPMHPTYISKQPGDCPICGMSLVAILDAVAKKSDTSNGSDKNDINIHANKAMYTCPMHPEILSDTEDRCPICKMRLVKTDKSPYSTSTKMESHTHTEEKSGRTMLEEIHIPENHLQKIGITYTEVIEKEINDELLSFGFISFDDSKRRKVHLRLNGFVLEVFKREGEYIKRGERLVRIYSPELYQIEEEYVSVLNNSPDSIVAQDLLKAIERKLILLNVDETEIKRLKTEKKSSEFLDITSDVSGYIVKKYIFGKEYITPISELFEIVDTRTVFLNLTLFEKDIYRVKNGSEVIFYPESSSSLQFKGRIEFINPYFERGLRVIKARALIKNEQSLLKEGMFGRAVVLMGKSKRLLLIRDAIVFAGEKNYVFRVVGDGLFEKVDVKIGIKYNDHYEIIDGLRRGDKVVLNGNFLIDSEGSIQSAFRSKTHNHCEH